MRELRTLGVFSCALLLLGSLSLSEPVLGANPSLCLSEPSGCDEPGSTVNLDVLLGPGDPTIVGVQFKLSYDPESLTAHEILPGSECDPTSPFTLEIHQQIDEANGTIFYAVGIDFVNGVGTNEAATVACIRFLPRGVSLSDISILVGTEPVETRMSNNFGHLVEADNSSTCPTNVAGVLSTKSVLVKDVCRCVDDSDCETLNSDCCKGVCDATSLLCKIMPVNEGGVCDDLNACTSMDRCAAGVCKGSGCNNPSLCFGSGCAPPGSLMTIPVLLGAGDPIVTGGQFSIQWDPTGLELVDVVPGSVCDPNSPFEMEITRVGSPSEGELFYAVGIAFDGEGTQGPATMACLFFRVLNGKDREICLFEDINPFHTRLVDNHGQLVEFYNDGTCSSDRGYPYIDCELGGNCKIPTTSEWGLVILSLVFLIGAKIAFRSRRVLPKPCN